MKLSQPLAPILRQLPPWGHFPDDSDVEPSTQGNLIRVRPNFRLCNVGFRALWLPLWQPLYPTPRNPVKGEFGRTINKGWPLEQPPPWLRWSRGWPDGHWIEVIDQVHAEELRDDAGNRSDVWNVIAVPVSRFRWRRKYGRRYQKITHNGVRCYKTYASDLWMGNSGWHKSPEV